MKENTNKMLAMTRRGLLAICIPASLVAQPFSRDDWGGRGNFQNGGLYEIVNVENGRVLDLDRNNGRTVIQFEPRGTRNQLWELRPAGAGRYNIVNAMNGSAIAELSPRRSTPVETFPLRGGGRRGFRGDAGAQMEWRIESYRDGSVMFISYSGNAIDIPNGTRRNGVQVQTYSRNGDGNQRFFLRPVNAGGGRGYRDGRDWDRDYRRPPY